MSDKCDALHGGNQCNRDAEYIITDLVGNYGTREGDLFACTQDIALVMQQHDLDRVEVEKI